MQALVEHFAAKGEPERVERCVLHLSIASLDLDQVRAPAGGAPEGRMPLRARPARLGRAYEGWGGKARVEKAELVCQTLRRLSWPRLSPT
jgi:hypothetical protein